MKPSKDQMTLQPIPPIIRAHFPPEHLISRDEIQKCHNKLDYDRTLLDTEKHRIKGHLEHVEQYGLMMDVEVDEKEAPAWEWVRPFLRKEEGEE